MKKIFILFMLLGSYLFVSVDLFASSYNDPVSQQTITIDTPITMLNGLSLYQVFGQTDLVKNVTNYTSEWQDIGVNASIYNAQFVFTPTYQYARLVNNNPNIYYSGDDTFFYASYKTTDGQAGLVVGDDYYFTDFIGFHNGTGNFYQVYGRRNYANVNSSTTYIGIRTQATSNFAEIKLASIYVVNLTYHGISNLSDFQLKYFLELYEILSLGITPTTYYNQGFGVGYGNGLEDYHNGIYNYLDPTQGIPYNDGYDIGNLQGYYDGYNDGLFDYHTGNNYGQYDYTLSEPYDQATQANISLLSVFQLIIGVVMSMLGFIINIELFGISIASVLGTLAIGIAIIWTLKLIRG